MAWEQLARHLYCWTDTCNVYALVHERRALLIDCGSGEVVEHLEEIGAEGVDWVLYTHHHREQCQGHTRLTAAGAKSAVPAAEAHLFRDPSCFWDDIDEHSVYGTIFVRPPRQALVPDRELADLETFQWGPYEIGVYATPGNSKGAVTYRVQLGRQGYLFSGDLVLEGGTLHTFYDNEWDYGHGLGPQTLCNSLTILYSLLPATVCPSHGSVLSQPRGQIRSLHRRLSRFIHEVYRRDWDWNDGIGGALGWFSKPTGLAGVRRFTPNLYKLGPYGSSCYLLLGKTGRGMMIDCGGLDHGWLDGALGRLQSEIGLRTIEVLIPTHVHGDHYTEAGYLREKWNTEVWCLDNFADLLEHPYQHNPTCLIPYYRLDFDAVPVARQLHPGEELEWDGFPLRIHHLPGQTWYAAGIEVDLGGHRVLFTGDNLFYTQRPGGSGHEAVVARNGSQIDLQYLAGAEKLVQIAPDWILTGHSSEIEKPERQIRNFLRWARELPEQMAQFSFFTPYSLYLDPYWCLFEPYIQRLAPGQEGSVEIILHNLYPEPTEFRVRPALPVGWPVQPQEWSQTLAPDEVARFTVNFRVPAEATNQTHLISADITAGECRWGEFFEARIDVLRPGTAVPRWYDRVQP